MIDVTFLISTYNRGHVLLETLAHLNRCGLPASRYEIIVVDNASTDSAADLVAHWFREVKLIRLSENRGPCAKNDGLKIARGKYVVFLDDDSFPQPGAVLGMLRKFEMQPSLGAAVFTVTLPSGQQECSAYPNVFIGCGTGFRREALDEVGGLPDDFFMQAEEYDLSLRLMNAGWRVERFDDLHVTHLKTPRSRYPERVMKLDVRNNILLAFRHFPLKMAVSLAVDWTKRYRMIAKVNGRQTAFWAGVAAGIWAVLRDGKRARIAPEAVEQFTRNTEIETKIRRWAIENKITRVLFVDLGKNSLAYHVAAKKVGLHVVGIADENLGGHGLRYRGVEILKDDAAMTPGFDGVVISNTSPVHARSRLAEWSQRVGGKVMDVLRDEAVVENVVRLAA